MLDGGSNPAADANGQIDVQPGDRIPGIPRHRGSTVIQYEVTPAWSIGGSAVLQSAQYRFGDEANLTKPVGGYVVVDLNTAYRVTPRITIFGVLNNIFDERYATYGGFAPVADVPWPTVPGGVTDPRTASPGMPFAGYAGVKIAF